MDEFRGGSIPLLERK